MSEEAPLHITCERCGSPWWVGAMDEGDRSEGQVAFDTQGRVTSFKGAFDCASCMAPFLGVEDTEVKPKLEVVRDG